MLRRVCKVLGFDQDSFMAANKLPLFVQGTTKPTDGTAGYAVGCLFFKRDGGDGTALYVNEGTETSCDFNAITVA